MVRILTNAETALKMGSVAVVKSHIKSIMRKIGVVNRTQAAMWIIRMALLQTAAFSNENQGASAKMQSDHNFNYQRIAIRDVLITGSAVRFNVETALKDDTDDANAYLGEVEVLVIADVYPDP